MKTWHAPLNVAYVILGAGIAVVGVLAPSARVNAQGNLQPEVTFSKDIAPILQQKCQNCHRPDGGMAPMYLTTYEEVRPWAKAIKRRTEAGEMPPWYIEKNIGIQHFKDDMSLSNAQIALIGNWVNAGAPQGNPADMPPPIQFADANSWSIGTPDLIVRSPLQVVKAVGGDVHLPYLGSVSTGLTEDRWIAAFQIREFRPEESKRSAGRPGGGNDYLVLHHQNISSNSAEPEETDPDVPRPVGGFTYTYCVGENAKYYPEGVGVKMPAGETIHFNQTHQHSIGKEVKFQVEVGFKFYPKGYTPKHEKRRGIGGRTPARSVDQRDIDIPGNTDNVRHEEFFTLDAPARMIAFKPHLHGGGKRMCVEVVYPDGTNETLNCAGYNHSWVRGYVYDDDYAPLLPKGTIVHVIGWYDNTANNPRVIDPRNWRGLGHRSIDEMMGSASDFLYYTDEEFKAEVTTREAKRRLTLTAAQNKKN